MAPAAPTPVSDAALRRDGADLVAELRLAVESLAERPPAAREAVRRVLESWLEEDGPDGPYAPSLHAALAELRPAAPAAAPEPDGHAADWKRLAALAFTSQA